MISKTLVNLYNQYSHKQNTLQCNMISLDSTREKLLNDSKLFYNNILFFKILEENDREWYKH